MKEDIFISYSQYDIKKVDLIVKELKNHPRFNPLIIAYNTEPLKPLTEKVSEGIIKAPYIIPILTKNSFQTQWINQEIGYATALKKKVLPIVSQDIMSDLKGFIHKEVDLTFNYPVNDKIGQENKMFIAKFRELITHLNTATQDGSSVPPPKKSKLDETRSLLRVKENELKLQKEKEIFFGSQEGIYDVEKEVQRLFEILKAKRDELDGPSLNIGFTPPQNYSCVLMAKGYSLKVSWHRRYLNTLMDAQLDIEYYKGFVANERIHYFLGKEPTKVKDFVYVPDLDSNRNIIWQNFSSKNKTSSDDLADEHLAWLIQKALGNLGK